ncbi:MAG: gamma-glutamyltransferase [Gammaproteobacteria bacterium]|nr:gamma-glutamyltransferase [Gammaproteobacteria bacterium]
MHASRAGIEVMQDGGNAVDGAVATGFALGGRRSAMPVTSAVVGSPSFGSPMVGSLLDHRETAPAAASEDMYLDGDGAVIPGLISRLAQGVRCPGFCRGLARIARSIWHDAPSPGNGAGHPPGARGISTRS